MSDNSDDNQPEDEEAHNPLDIHEFPKGKNGKTGRRPKTAKPPKPTTPEEYMAQVEAKKSAVAALVASGDLPPQRDAKGHFLPGHRNVSLGPVPRIPDLSNKLLQICPYAIDRIYSIIMDADSGITNALRACELVFQYTLPKPELEHAPKSEVNLILKTALAAKSKHKELEEETGQVIATSQEVLI